MIRIIRMKRIFKLVNIHRISDSVIYGSAIGCDGTRFIMEHLLWNIDLFSEYIVFRIV